MEKIGIRIPTHKLPHLLPPSLENDLTGRFQAKKKQTK